MNEQRSVGRICAVALAALQPIAFAQTPTPSSAGKPSTVAMEDTPFIASSSHRVGISLSTPVNLGQGYNSITGLFRGIGINNSDSTRRFVDVAAAINSQGLTPARPNGESLSPGLGAASPTPTPTASPAPPGQRKGDLAGKGLGQVITYEVVYLENASYLRDYLNIALSASMSLGPFKASAKADYVRTHTENANSAYLVVNVRVLNALQQLTAYELTDQALRLIEQDKPSSFINTYGDEFVTAVQTGGEFIGIVELQFKSVSDHSNFSASLSASYMGFNFSGSFIRDIKQDNLNFSVKSSIMKTGGRDGITFIDSNASPTPTAPGKGTPPPVAKTPLADQLGNAFEKVLKEAQNFPAEVAENPIVYSVVTSDYNIASNLPTGARAPTLNYARRALQSAVILRDVLRAEAQSKITQSKTTTKTISSEDGAILDDMIQENSPMDWEIVKWISQPWALEQNERRRRGVGISTTNNLSGQANMAPAGSPIPGPFKKLLEEPGNKLLYQQYQQEYLTGKPAPTLTPNP
ncbi:MAG: hypothetical protein ACRD3P_04955 [Terriglobales bacterium]